MRNILIIFVFFFSLNESYSQQFTTKLYGNIFSYVPELDGDNIYDNLSFGIEYQTKKNHIHEFEVLSIDFFNQNSESIDSENQIYTRYYNRSELAFRYKYKTISFIEKENLSFYLSTSPLFIYTKSEDSTRYLIIPLAGIGDGIIRNEAEIGNEDIKYEYRRNKRTYFTSSLSIIPTVNYRIKNFINLSLSIPIDIYTFEIYTRELNPYSEETFKNHSSLPSQFYLKFSIGFRVYEKTKTTPNEN